uniref:Uncharacterized protein n=1 Tax=Setaria viridis TaxID=4556 RepID=A0A4V6D3N4_SETVI|nr:hypothetical protein SEVIR_7G014500v2 [Setaria viridis]
MPTGARGRSTATAEPPPRRKVEEEEGQGDGEEKEEGREGGPDPAGLRGRALGVGEGRASRVDGTDPRPSACAHEQRGSGKRPLSDVPRSALSSRAKHTCRPRTVVSAAPRDFVLPLASKKALRASAASRGPTMTLPGASGGVVGGAVVPPMEAASAAAIEERVLQSGMEQGPTPVPSSALAADPAGQDAAPGVPPSSEVINLDDEAEEEPVREAPVSEASVMEAAATAVAETVARASVVTTEIAVVAEMVAPAPTATTEMAAVVETVAPTPAAAMEMAALAPVTTMEMAVSGLVGESSHALILLSPDPNACALQECSRGKSEFLWREQGVWERFAMEMRRTGELTGQLAAAQQNAADLRAREREAREGARRAEVRVTTEKARRDAEELARLRKEHEALQKTVERIRHERHTSRQERDLEVGRKAEAEKMAANLGAEVSRLESQMQGLQTAVSQGLDRVRAQSEGLEGDLARLRDAADAEHVEHANLWDAVRIVYEDLNVVQEEGTSALVARVLGTYRGGYGSGYSEAELDEIDVSVFNPAEALAQLLKDEAIPPEDPGMS